MKDIYCGKKGELFQIPIFLAIISVQLTPLNSTCGWRAELEQTRVLILDQTEIWLSLRGGMPSLKMSDTREGEWIIHYRDVTFRDL